MGSVEDYLNQALSAFTPDAPAPVEPVVAAPSLTDTKKSQVSEAALLKKQAMGMPSVSPYQLAVSRATDVGGQSLNERDTDMRNMDAMGLYAKYGPEARQMLEEITNSDREVGQDMSAPQRDGFDTTYDTATSFGMGFGNAVGGLVNLPIAAIDDGAGTAVSQAMGDANEWIRGTQSDSLNTLRNIVESQNQLDSIDQAALYEVEKETEGDFRAGLNDIGRSAVSSVANASSDSMTFADSTTNALGSLFAGGPIGKGIKAAALALPGAKTIAASNNIVTAALSKIGNKAVMPAAIGGIEAGGAYQQITQDILGRDHETMLKEFPKYQELLAQDVSPADARAQIANEVGLESAAITGPTAALIGKLTGASKFEGNVLGRKSATEMIGNILREPVEEGLQGGSSQVAQNYSEQQAGNTEKTLNAGVGRQVGEGALFGLGMTVGVQAPGLAKAAVVGSAKAAFYGGADFVANQAKKAMSANDAASPISDEAVSEAAATAEVNLPQTQEILADAVNLTEAAPEQKDELTAYFDKVVGAASFSADEVPANVAPIVASATNRVDAIQRLATHLETLPEDSADYFHTGYAMFNLIVDYTSVIEANDVAMDNIPKDHPAHGVISDYNTLAISIQDSPKVLKAIKEIADYLGKRPKETVQPDLSEAAVATPEGQQRAQDVIATAVIAVSPLVGNKNVLQESDLAAQEIILGHITKGTVAATEQQKAALHASIALLKATKLANEEQVRLGNTGPAYDVSRNITSEKGTKGESALQHTQGILSAYKAGNLDLASSRMGVFHDFVKSMQNKVDAVNSDLVAGDPKSKGVSYQTVREGKWFEAAAPMKLHRHSESSVKFVQTVAVEAKLLADVYSGLVTAFPDVKSKHIVGAQLAKELTLPAQEVVANFTKPTPSAAPVVAEKATPTVSTPDVKIASNKIRLSEMSDEQLNNRLVTLQDRLSAGDESYREQFNRLDAEMSKREDIAQAANEAAELVETVAPEVTAPVAKEEQVVEPEPVVEESPATVEETPVVKGVNTLFPNLVPSSQFTKVFKFAKEQKSRIMGDDSPIATLLSVLDSSASLTAFVGKTLPHNFTAEIADDYYSLLGNAKGIVKALEANLQERLNTKYSKENPVTQKQLLLGEATVSTKKGTTFDATRVAQGKVFNLVDVVDGEVSYNQSLVEAAALAGLQWLNTADQISSLIEAENVASITGLSLDQVTPEMVNQFSQGIYSVEAKRSLATKISQYWGLQADSSKPTGLTEGIPEAMAAEVLRVLSDTGGLTKITYAVTKEGQVALVKEDGVQPQGTIKTIIQLVPVTKAADHSLSIVPSAIDAAVLLEPEQSLFIGSDSKVPVSKKQLNNPYVDNTPSQLQAIKENQKTPYVLNPVMATLYQSLGLDTILSLLGEGDLSKRSMNENHFESANGKNRSVAAAFNHLTRMVGEIGNVASATGALLQNTPLFYQMNMTSVGRLQMIGRYTPQSNKFVRAAILPTNSTLNLSDRNSKDYSAFMLGIAQALGVKVHKVFRQKAISQAQELIDGKYAKAIEALTDWVDGYAEPDGSNLYEQEASPELGKILKEAGVNTAEQLHALTELAWLSQQTPEGRKAFKSTIYLEADGMTNGPINAMMLFIGGAFSSLQLKNLGKGGMFFNRPGHTANAHNEEVDNEDLYQATTDVLKGELDLLRTVLKEGVSNNKVSPDVVKQMDHLQNLMSLFLGDELSFDTAGNLVLSRGIAKNPLTITIYGSGAGGIAAKMTKAVVDALYERMSDVAEAKRKNPEVSYQEAMFGTGVDAADKYNRFVTSFAALTAKKLTFGKGKYGLSGTTAPAFKGKYSPETFTLSTAAVENIQSNMLHLFVSPMRNAIEQTIGSKLVENTTLLRKATQVQSIILEQAFADAVEYALEQKRKTDPNFHESDFLSGNELREIHDNLSYLSPFVKTKDQTFYVAGSMSNDVKGTQFGHALNGAFRSDGYVYGPADAGVSGIPFLTIGTGDGLMMQLISNAANAIKGTLKVFDGMNMPLDKIDEGSLQANQAVLETWKRNPLEAVYTSYAKFMENNDIVMSSATKQKLVKALFPPAFWKDDSIAEGTIKEAMEALLPSLNTAQLEITARHNVMGKVPVTVDQMAAAGASFTSTGTLNLVSQDSDALAQELNVLYEKEIETLLKTKGSISSEIASVGVVQKSGVTLIDSASLAQLPKILSMPAGQQALLSEAVSALKDRDYSVLVGSPAEVAQYMLDNNLPALPELKAGTNGVTMIHANRVILFNPSNEVLVHELIHASTFTAVLSHYRGKTNQKLSGAVARLEALMDNFLSVGDTLNNESAATLEAYASAEAAINERMGSDAESKAIRLNEFMAWALANQSLAKLLGKTKASALVLIADKVVQALAKFFGIATKPGMDMLSNLRFNTSIVMATQAKWAERLSKTVLFMNSTYGDNPRLATVQAAFNNTVGRYMNSTPTASVHEAQSATKRAIITAARIGESFMAHGWHMNKQASSTFETIVAALATEAQIDPNAMAAVQSLYLHTIKQLSVESFMKDSTGKNDTDRYYAQEKYNSIMGSYLVDIDIKGRTTLLPSFLALAVVNDEFREVLAKLPMPASYKNSTGNFDGLLESSANNLMSKLTDKISGIGGSTNVQQAIDGLTTKIIEVTEAREQFIDQVAATTGGYLDRGNEIVTNGLSNLSIKLRDANNSAIARNASPLVLAVTKLGAGVAAVINEDAGRSISEGMLSSINKTNMWKPFHSLLNNLVGRTESNAPIFDMIKAVRSAVQQTRQQYREHLPTKIASKFSRKLNGSEWSDLFHSMAKTDIAALFSGRSAEDTVKLLSSAASVAAEVSRLETSIQMADPAHYSEIQRKANQLATYMRTGVAGSNLLRNAEAISLLLNEPKKKGWATKPAAYIKELDQLISLYAFTDLAPAVKSTFVSLAQTEEEGMSFALSYLKGQRVDEGTNSKSRIATLNGYKGYAPSLVNHGVSLIVASDRTFSKRVSMSYTRIGDYKGSTIESGKSKQGYYYASSAARAGFDQGIMQNVRQTSNGVDAVSGYTIGNLAGRVTDPATVKKLVAIMDRDTGKENLMPLYDENGQVFAFERTVDPVVMERVQAEQNLALSLGMWRGRQIEESMAQEFNHKLIDKLKDVFDVDMRKSSSNIKQYININDLGSLDPVLRDAVALFSQDTRDYIGRTFGADFMIRKDMLDDALGYRAASVGDAWTGTSEWSPKTQENVRNLAISIFGNGAYQMMVNAEQSYQNLISDAKVLIVIKSVVVPITNVISNVYQLTARGVPLVNTLRSAPKKVAEIEAYTKSRLRQIEAEAELRAANSNPNLARKLEAEIRSIADSHKRLSIWPLLEAGEFSSITDVGLTKDEIMLSSGKLQQYIEAQIAKLPTPIATAGRYALISKDTALFQGLQKAVEYGDFIAKAILFDDLVQRKKLSQKEAMGRISEEFVNYDRLPGRFRGALEKNGLLWFYNFKIRSVKIALSMIRNNPVHTLLATLAPVPTLFGSVGMPTTDNMFTHLIEGKLDNSMGIGQGLRAPMLNPWHNLIN